MSTGSPFNSLEAAVVEAIVEQYPVQRFALLSQFKAISIVSRENSGAGFFVYLEVDQEATEPVIIASPIGDVFARISGFKHPMGFLIFLKKGYVKVLEGYCQGDDETATVDFENIEFTVFDPTLDG